MIYNILSSSEITDIMNNPIVKTNKALLSDTQKVVRFSIPLVSSIKTKLEKSLSITLPCTVPMRWIKGDIPPHTDKGDKRFNNTYFIYLTDSIGNLFVDGQSYPITAGNAHIFKEGLEHYTVNTGNSERLMIGPVDELGSRVGPLATAIKYFSSKTDATIGTLVLESSTSYMVKTVNNISQWVIYSSSGGSNPTPNGTVRNTGDTLNDITAYYYSVYPYIPRKTYSVVNVIGGLCLVALAVTIKVASNISTHHEENTTYDTCSTVTSRR
jgi:hypothetical protein